METTSFVRPSPIPNITKRVKGKAQTRSRNGQSSKNENKRPDSRGSLVIFKPTLRSQTVDRSFRIPGLIRSTAAGVIALTATGGQDIITSLGTEWSNFAQEFSEFRVKSVGIEFTPSTTNSTATTGPYQGVLLVTPWAQLKPTTSASVLQADQITKFSTLEEREVQVNPPAFPNAALWNPVGTALPIDRDYGFTYISVGSVLAVSSDIFTGIFKIHAEFKVPF